MLFNPDKCERMITDKRRITQTSYTIHSQTLKETSQAKYLGVIIDDKLTWNSHTDLVTKWANQTTVFLCINLPTCTKEVKTKCCNSLVRPQLECAATIWDPHSKVNATKEESVQRRAARFCFIDYRQTSSVTSIMQEFGLEDLQAWRQLNKAIIIGPDKEILFA